jgi:hypothetical protein
MDYDIQTFYNIFSDAVDKATMPGSTGRQLEAEIPPLMWTAIGRLMWTVDAFDRWHTPLIRAALRRNRLPARGEAMSRIIR